VTDIQTLGEYIGAHVLTSGECDCELTKVALSCIRFVVNPSADFNSQPKLVLINQPRKDERLSWLAYMRVNNLLKVITHRKSSTAGI